MKRTDYDRLFSSRPVDRIAAIVTSPSRGNGAMAFAFERAGYQSEQPPEPEPEPPPPERNPYAAISGKRTDRVRERISVDQTTIAAMSDEELDVEMLALEENVETLRADLAAFHKDRSSRDDPRWHVRAERAQSALRTRLQLCRLEQQRRTARAAALRKEEADSERIRAHVRASERERLINERTNLGITARAEKRAAFVRHAKAILPPETFAAIWDAVNREVGDFET